MPVDDGVMLSDDALRSDSVFAIVGAGVSVISDGDRVGLPVITPTGKSDDPNEDFSGDPNDTLNIPVGTGFVLPVITPTGISDASDGNVGADVLVTFEGNEVGLIDVCLAGVVVGEAATGDLDGVNVGAGVLVIFEGSEVGLLDVCLVGVVVGEVVTGDSMVFVGLTVTKAGTTSRTPGVSEVGISGFVSL